MKISELVKKTGVPKETIHFYIREGLLRKPRKSGVNAAEYNQKHVEQLLLIKDLRNNYYLPIPEIKKVVKNFKKQSPTAQAVSQVNSRYFRPMDRLLETDVVGKEAFRKETGLGPKWLDKMEQWGIITSKQVEGHSVYSQDDLIIGRLVVDIDKLGFGPKDGYNPKDLKPIADFIRDYVASGQNKYLKAYLEKMKTGETHQDRGQITEIMSLFFYHMYRKLVREQYRQILKSNSN